MIQTASASASEANTLARVEGKGFAARVYFSPQNQRIQVLEYEAEDAPAMVSDLEAKAREAGFGKLFLKAPAVDRLRLKNAGMCEEATIEGYFNGQPASVMSLFLSNDRRRRPFADTQHQILEQIRQRPADSSVPKLPEGYEMSAAGIRDVTDVAQLYRAVFASYPFPITEPSYIATTMRSNVLYRIVRDAEGHVVGAASAETDPDLENAEMTDFATLPDQRGLGLAQHLLAALEDDMAERNILNLYTIARARSAGMNRVFYNRDYTLTGTLVNNCHIAGQFEDMHVWCKRLAPLAQN